MAAPHQNIADIVVLKASAEEPGIDDVDLDGGAPVGHSLATMRKAKGLTLADIHAGTKIKPAHIAAIEAGDLSALPATPFTAGFVKAYAQFLGLDADAFARAYKQEAGFVPLAAPALTAIMRQAAKTRAAETRDDDAVLADADLPPAPSPSTAVAAAAAPFAAPVLAATPYASAPASASRRADPDRMVTWLGVGAAIAVVAFLAGRALQPQQTKTEIIAPPPTIIAEAPAAAPAPEPVAVEPATVEIAPPAVEQAPPPTVVAAVKAPTVKPRPKQPPADEAPPAPIEATPVPVLFTMPIVDAPASADAEAAPAAAIAADEPPAPPAAIAADEPPAAPEPTIVPARMIRGATPLYPERCAGRAGETVAVSLIFSVTPDGRPVSASVISSTDRCFNPAAQRAVYDMRFSPRTVDGVPALETGKTVTVQFVR